MTVPRKPRALALGTSVAALGLLVTLSARAEAQTVSFGKPSWPKGRTLRLTMKDEIRKVAGGKVLKAVGDQFQTRLTILDSKDGEPKAWQVEIMRSRSSASTESSKRSSAALLLSLRSPRARPISSGCKAHMLRQESRERHGWRCALFSVISREGLGQDFRAKAIMNCIKHT